MDSHLRQSTERIVRIGPVVAVGDGFVPVTTLDVSTADEAELLKDTGGVVDISGATFAAITTADGYYNLTLTTSFTDTVGPLTVLIHDDSLCLPVRHNFEVIEENVYDAIYASSAALGTDVTAILADTGTDGVALAAGAIGTGTFAAGAMNAAALASDIIDVIFAGTALTESYAADGATATPAQLLYMILAMLTEFSISGTTMTVKKLDGSTTAGTYTLDDAVDPTSLTRAS